MLTTSPVAPTTPKRPNRAISRPTRGGRAARGSGPPRGPTPWSCRAWRPPNSERNLGHAQPRRAHEDLEQDLEAVWVQAVEVERVAPDQEEAAHRVGHVPEPREQRERRARRDPRHRLRARAGTGRCLRRAQNRLATTSCAAVASAWASMSSIASGGCWRSASITQTHSPRAIRMPSTTAPPRPPCSASPRAGGAAARCASS